MKPKLDFLSRLIYIFYVPASKANLKFETMQNKTS